MIFSIYSYTLLLSHHVPLLKAEYHHDELMAGIICEKEGANMERFISVGKDSYQIFSMENRGDGYCRILYWKNEPETSGLKEIKVRDYILLRSGNTEIIKVMDRENLYS